MPTFMRSLIWTDQGIRSIKADIRQRDWHVRFVPIRDMDVLGSM